MGNWTLCLVVETRYSAVTPSTASYLRYPVLLLTSARSLRPPEGKRRWASGRLLGVGLPRDRRATATPSTALVRQWTHRRDLNPKRSSPTAPVIALSHVTVPRDVPVPEIAPRSGRP